MKTSKGERCGRRLQNFSYPKPFGLLMEVQGKRSRAELSLLRHHPR
jgi:hypothetical protein